MRTVRRQMEKFLQRSATVQADHRTKSSGIRLALLDHMGRITSYRDLLAWQRAMDLPDLVYEITEVFPRREWWGLASQMRKSAVSIPSNIAEGHRRNIAGYTHHLMISLGSHAELETQVMLGNP